MPQLRAPVLLRLDHNLKAAADPRHRETVRDHFASNVDRFYGVRIPNIRKLAAEAVAADPLPPEQRWQFCDELAATGIFEHKIAAFHFARLGRHHWTEKELPRFARWLHEAVDDWMDADDLCIRVLGEFFLRFPAHAASVLEWSRLPNPWSRRGSAVSLIPSARKGAQWELVAAVCELILDDPEPLVAKACGWLLKVASRPHPAKVRDFVAKAGDRMPAPVRRTALEKLKGDGWPR